MGQAVGALRAQSTRARQEAAGLMQGSAMVGGRARTRQGKLSQGTGLQCWYGKGRQCRELGLTAGGSGFGYWWLRGEEGLLEK